MNNDIKIRDYIIDNFKNDDAETIKKAIEESIRDEDEVALPGLGIFFILIWEKSDDSEREALINKIYQQIKKG